MNCVFAGPYPQASPTTFWMFSYSANTWRPFRLIGRMAGTEPR